MSRTTFDILLFAHLAEVLGARRLTIELEEGATVADALDAIADAHPPFGPHRGTTAVAIDERYASPDTVIPAGATVALIPPVSGG